MQPDNFKWRKDKARSRWALIHVDKHSCRCTNGFFSVSCRFNVTIWTAIAWPGFTRDPELSSWCMSPRQEILLQRAHHSFFTRVGTYPMTVLIGLCLCKSLMPPERSFDYWTWLVLRKFKAEFTSGFFGSPSQWDLILKTLPFESRWNLLSIIKIFDFGWNLLSIINRFPPGFECTHPIPGTYLHPTSVNPLHPAPNYYRNPCYRICLLTRQIAL